jgi:tyrosine-protein phosphatase YwqE
VIDLHCHLLTGLDDGPQNLQLHKPNADIVSIGMAATLQKLATGFS